MLQARSILCTCTMYFLINIFRSHFGKKIKNFVLSIVVGLILFSFSMVSIKKNNMHLNVQFRDVGLGPRAKKCVGFQENIRYSLVQAYLMSRKIVLFCFTNAITGHWVIIHMSWHCFGRPRDSLLLFFNSGYFLNRFIFFMKKNSSSVSCNCFTF